MNILVVDDSSTNRKLLRISLEPEGHTILEAEDGVEALALLEREAVDAVISDILMPNMDGYQLCHELRHSGKFQHLPFIHYTSTYTSPADQKLSESVGADRYLTKPASVETLLSALAQPIQSDQRKGSQASDTTFIMKQYSQRLVSKLEEKNSDLEAAQVDLFRAHKKLLQHAAEIEKLNTELEQRVRERTAELEKTNQELRQVLAEVKELSGLLPICGYCKKIRDGEDYWQSVETYVAAHTKAQFSHSYCPDCFEKIVRPEMETVLGRERAAALKYPAPNTTRREAP